MQHLSSPGLPDLDMSMDDLEADAAFDLDVTDPKRGRLEDLDGFGQDLPEGLGSSDEGED